tara:strand:- start:33559 stop:33873 length:315 start_codon:yes stop_codon:yes gene_type:complete
MPAGEMRHRVTLEKRAQASDTEYSIVTSYAAIGVAWAKIEAVKGGIYEATIQVGEGPTHRIVMRYRANDFDFITDGTRRWEVADSRDPTGRRQYLVIMAEEQTA